MTNEDGTAYPVEKKVVATISKEDLSYLKKLHARVDGVKNMIGDIEIAKQRLFNDYNVAINEEAQFVNQLYVKHNIDSQTGATISESGEMTLSNDK